MGWAAASALRSTQPSAGPRDLFAALALTRAILYKRGFRTRRARKVCAEHPRETRREQHGRSETQNIAVAARDAPLRRCAGAADLRGGQGFGRAAPAPPHRSQDRYVPRPAGPQVEEGGLTAAFGPIPVCTDVL